MLSKEALPVKAANKEPLATPVPCLMLPAQSQNLPLTLIAATFTLKTDQEIQLEIAEQSYTAKLEKNYSFSRSYQQFELHFVGDATPQVKWHDENKPVAQEIVKP